jgi:predicted amidophosphoribosyltransferase
VSKIETETQELTGIFPYIVSFNRLFNRSTFRENISIEFILATIKELSLQQTPSYWEIAAYKHIIQRLKNRDLTIVNFIAQFLSTVIERYEILNDYDVVTFFPSSVVTESSGIADVVLGMDSQINKSCMTLLERIKSLEQNHLHRGKRNTVQDHLDSLITVDNTMRKGIILVDDVTTSGNSILAGLELLQPISELPIICICVSRTVNLKEFEQTWRPIERGLGYELGKQSVKDLFWARVMSEIKLSRNLIQYYLTEGGLNKADKRWDNFYINIGREMAQYIGQWESRNLK